MEDKMFDLMTKMYNEMQGMNSKIESIEQNMGRMESKINTVEQNIVRMENKIDTKLSALFDGYTQNTEQLNRITEEVAKHEEVIIRRVK
jgi:predicted  nucleic acid-binding Zn-ribbon protein